MKNEIVLSTDVQRLLDTRRAVLKLLGQAVAAIKEAERLAREAGLGDRPSWMSQDVLSEFRFGDPLPLLRQELDRAGWRHLLAASGMEAVMDAQAREELDRQLYGGEVPELTMENVLATFQDLAVRKGELFERGVINCFKSLSWDYKSNSPVAFGKKIIINDAVAFHPEYGFRVEYQAMRRVEDLERIFHLLDDKPVPEHRHMATARMSAALMADRFRDSLDLEYFQLKWYRKGSLHLTFQCPDLVKKLNRILAKHFPDALPTAA